VTVGASSNRSSMPTVFRGWLTTKAATLALRWMRLPPASTGAAATIHRAGIPAERFTVPEQPVSSIAPAEPSWSCCVYEVEFRAYDRSSVSYR
jgi:hypothetical protein